MDVTSSIDIFCVWKRGVGANCWEEDGCWVEGCWNRRDEDGLGVGLVCVDLRKRCGEGVCFVLAL